MGPKFSFLKTFGGFLTPFMQEVSMKSDMKKERKYCMELQPNLMLQFLRVLPHMESHSNENAVLMSTLLFYILLLSFLFLSFFKTGLSDSLILT